MAVFWKPSDPPGVGSFTRRTERVALGISACTIASTRPCPVLFVGINM